MRLHTDSSAPSQVLVGHTFPFQKKKKKQLIYLGFPDGSDVKESAYNAEEPGLIPGYSLEKGMATHSNILAWRIPWTEEPGRLQSTGLQIVRRN